VSQSVIVIDFEHNIHCDLNCRAQCTINFQELNQAEGALLALFVLYKLFTGNDAN